MSKYIFIVALFIMGFSSCYKAYDPVDDLVDIVGDVAQIATFTGPAKVTHGATFDLTLKVSSAHVEMDSIRIYEKNGSGGYILTKHIAFTPNFVEAERLHVITIPYTAPDAPTSISLQANVVTSNGLVSNPKVISKITVE